MAIFSSTVSPPLPATILLLPLNPRMGPGPVPVRSMKDAFEAFQPRLQAMVDGVFTLDRALAHLRDFDSARWLEDGGDAGDSLSTLWRLRRRYDDLLKRWRLPNVRQAWEDTSRRPSMLDQLHAFHPATTEPNRPSVLDEIFSQGGEESSPALTALSSLRSILDHSASHEEIEGRLRRRLAEIESARQRLVQAGSTLVQPLARNWSLLALFLENLRPLPPEIWPSTYVFNVDPLALADEMLVQLEEYAMRLSSSPRFERGCGQIVAPGALDEATTARLTELARQCHALLVTDGTAEPPAVDAPVLGSTGLLRVSTCAAPISAASALAAVVAAAEIAGATTLQPVAGSLGFIPPNPIPRDGPLAYLAADSAGRPSFVGPFLRLDESGLGHWLHRSRYLDFLAARCRVLNGFGQPLLDLLADQRASGWLKDYSVYHGSDGLRVELTPCARGLEQWVLEFPLASAEGEA